jgi:hypothetical protein
MKISNKKFSFFSTRNQYFPHIPYVASKKCVGFWQKNLQEFSRKFCAMWPFHHKILRKLGRKIFDFVVIW